MSSLTYKFLLSRKKKCSKNDCFNQDFRKLPTEPHIPEASAQNPKHLSFPDNQHCYFSRKQEESSLKTRCDGSLLLLQNTRD